MADVLIVYGAYQYPVRATTWSHLYSFARYSGHRCFYLNLRLTRDPYYRKVPSYVLRSRFDLIIFHTDLLGIQWAPNGLEQFSRRAGDLRYMPVPKVALVQDEYYNTDVLGHFINEFDIGFVFSLAPESEWRKIYPMVDFDKVSFFRNLPGYLDEDTLARIETLARSVTERPVDIGYRAYGIRQCLGRHGFLKIQIADLFRAKASSQGLETDISTRLEDTFLGDDWYRFLLRCKYTIGVEGGATVLDRDGTIAAKTESYLAQHPQASFEAVEANCFSGQDDYYRYVAISPRHLEACATKTCQVLVEGQYNGILVPNKHYIELKRDFSNIEHVLATIKRDDLRAEITERAYQDVVQSGLYTYRSFVRFVVENSLGRIRENPEPSEVRERLVYMWMRVADTLSWARLAIRTSLSRLAKTVLPSRLIGALYNLLARSRQCS